MELTWYITSDFQIWSIKTLDILQCARSEKRSSLLTSNRAYFVNPWNKFDKRVFQLRRPITLTKKVPKQAASDRGQPMTVARSRNDVLAQANVVIVYRSRRNRDFTTLGYEATPTQTQSRAAENVTIHFLCLRYGNLDIFYRRFRKTVGSVTLGRAHGCCVRMDMYSNAPFMRPNGNSTFLYRGLWNESCLDKVSFLKNLLSNHVRSLWIR